MSLLVIVLGLLLLAVPAATAHTRVGPAARVRLASASASAGVLVLGLGMTLSALPLVMVWHDGEEAVGLGLTHLSPGGPVAWAAGGALGGTGLAWLGATFSRTVRLRRRAALPRWVAESVHHDDCAGAEVRVAPSRRPIAFAVPGRDRHVVISRAMMSMLTEAELRAVLAHEGAHLRLRHDRYLLILTIYERLLGWLPGVCAVVARHRHAIEQWADGHAGRHPVDADALPAARRRVGSCLPLQTAAQLRASNDSPLYHYGWIAAAGVALVAASGYLAAHVTGDIIAVMAILH